MFHKLKESKISIVKYLTIFSLLLWFLSQIPFVSADADISMNTGSRGSWTDEGLNTSQIRNYVNHKHFDLLECDNFLKTPFFSAYLFIPFKLFDTKFEVARFSVLILILLALLHVFRYKELRLMLFFLILTTLLLLPIHQYSHLSLAEMCATSLILISALFYWQYSLTKKIKNIFLSTLFVFCAFLFKIQFVYVLIIPLASLFFDNLLQLKRLYNKHFVLSILFFGVLLSLMYFVFYLPFKSEFEFLFKQQGGNFSWETISYNYFKENIKNYFFNKDYIVFTALFILSFIFAFRIVFSKTIKSTQKALIIFALMWFFVECHKLPMYYLPVRYVISLYFSMGLLISIVFAVVFQNYKQVLPRIVILLMIVGLLFFNSQLYLKALKNRTYDIKHLNEYLLKCNIGDEVVIGSWAPAITWYSKSISLPIWKNFLRKPNPILTYKPTLIVSEPNEDDSEQTYRNLKINLNEISDSIKNVKIARWDINLYWVNKKIN